ncbi:MAG TPA: permease-like cell division protein FtsX [Burkholderiales bacterium]|nr:permease-like cell division protein FtsX [Burkholderiales bacterium]
MKAWLWHHLDSLRFTLVRLARAPFSALLNIGVIGIALALPAGFYVVLANLQNSARALASEPQLSLFLALDATHADSAQIEARLKQHPGVRGFRYVPRDQALAELKEGTGLADVVDSLAQNPLPDAYIVDPRDSAPQALEALQAEFGRWPKIAHVQLDAAWARRLQAGLKLGRLAVAILTALFAFALIAVTFNTIRLQILTRRDEIEVARLIGATGAFIRRPFLYFGALQGLAGGAAAWAMLWFAIHLLNDGLSELSQLYGTRLELSQLSPGESAVLLIFSTGLGLLGSWLSVSQHLGRSEIQSAN